MSGTNSLAGAPATGVALLVVVAFAIAEPRPPLPDTTSCEPMTAVEGVSVSCETVPDSTGMRVRFKVLCAPGVVIGRCGNGVPHMPQNRMLGSFSNPKEL